MGGKSKSSQQSSSTNTSTNINNDGEFAGAGSVALDESDHSIENDGDYAGNNGTITVTDGGAVDAAFSFGSDALDSNELALREAFGFGSDALDGVQSVAVSAFDNAQQQSESYSDNIESIISASQSTQQKLITDSAKSNTQDRELIAKLAASTSLAGQDLVAKSSERMTLYMAVALGVGFLAIVIFGRRQ